MGQNMSSQVQSARRRLRNQSPPPSARQDEGTSDGPSRPILQLRRSSRLLSRLQRLRSRPGGNSDDPGTPSQSNGSPNSLDTSRSRETSPTSPTSPSMMHDSDDNNDDHALMQQPPTQRRRIIPRHASMLGDALPSWRGASSDRINRAINPLRRRRPTSTRGTMDDQMPVLSQLLSAAAAATAASLMGDDPNAIRNARGIGGDESTLETFLESLQNGRISNALLTRNDSNSEDGGNGNINFVRLFRFGAATGPAPAPPASAQSTSHATTGGFGGNDSVTAWAEDDNAEGRMVPIIIVGIRSIPPSRTGTGEREENPGVPEFLDALTALEDTPHGEVPDAAGPSTGATTPSRFSHTRRRSMGGIGGYESQRHQQRRGMRGQSPVPRRPFSAMSEEVPLMPAPPGSRPPPSTPASTGLSAVSSGATTPTPTVSSSTFNSPSNISSRRPSFVPVTSADPLSNIRSAIDNVEAGPSFPTRRARRNRRLSDSDFSLGSRRHGMVEPDETPADGNAAHGNSGSSRSWIIYVLGGSYPENHPLLNTPSLFTDSPTYEDMMLLSTLLGPAKPPVATEQEVQAANGVFEVRNVAGRPGRVEAYAIEGGEVITIEETQRCLVCLSDYEVGETARRLIVCGHLFHRECIDTWLTTGRNSCPLCRREGVQKKSQPNTTGSNSSNSTSPSSPSIDPSVPETHFAHNNSVPDVNMFGT